MHEKSIELLNKAVAEELSATHQYMYFHFHCDDQAYDLIAGLFMRTAIEEMGHVEVLADLEGRSGDGARHGCGENPRRKGDVGIRQKDGGRQRKILQRVGQ